MNVASRKLAPGVKPQNVLYELNDGDALQRAFIMKKIDGLAGGHGIEEGKPTCTT